MRKAYLAIALAAVLILAAGLTANEKTVTWEGTLVDSHCYLMNSSFTGNNHQTSNPACGTMCLRLGYPAALVTKDSQFHVIIWPTRPLDLYVGREIRVTGTVHNGAILAEKIEVKKAGQWQVLKPRLSP